MSIRTVFCCAAIAALTASAWTAAPETFGTGVTASEVTPLARLIERPAQFEGKTVRVEGVVTGVCTAMGCWMALAPEGAAAARSPSATMMLKVDDGVIVFPVSAKGRRAAAQGVVQRVGGGDHHDREAAREHAKQEGRPAESAANWQIKATGAVVY